MMERKMMAVRLSNMHMMSNVLLRKPNTGESSFMVQKPLVFSSLLKH
jgi:hypothetical protein